MAKILIIDDSDVLRLELKDVLERGGHTVIDANNGIEGYNKALENTDIDILITDLNMPEMDGISMCRKLRELEAFAKTPFFMLTTEAGADLKAAGKSAGVMLWIIKPFSPDKLLAAVEKVLKMLTTQ